MALDCTPDDTALAVAEMYAEAEMLGFAQHQAEDAICEYLTELRTTARQQRWLNTLLRPYGFAAVAVPVWRSATWH